MPITAFKPSIHGFHFENKFSSKDIMEEMYPVPSWMLPEDTWYLCGGMCFAALDRFFQKEKIPELTTPPSKGTSLFHELVERQLASVDSVGWTIILFYQTSPDEGSQLSLGHLSQSIQWPPIMAKLDFGIPTTVCLIRAGRGAVSSIGDNHQVIAYGYSINSGRVTLNVYDPVYPNNDNVVVGFSLGQEGGKLDADQTPGPNPRGFLHVPYDRAEVVISLASVLEAYEDGLEWMWTIF
jgi:hypothetical protein